nr:unnamed protein product [Digitaria exilis]
MEACSCSRSPPRPPARARLLTPVCSHLPPRPKPELDPASSAQSRIRVPAAAHNCAAALRRYACRCLLVAPVARRPLARVLCG